ncbi:chemotaxis protein CheY [Clostridium sp. CAG:411]|jgi:two-component system chemotaxis response regulator CheY|nr:response regulator [Lachnospiraceae bacterium]CDE47510.1 chemotaxis protein CheY [Clostridium sp. CAG:411]
MKQTILVVDDSPFVYHQLKDMVEDSDYEVIGSAKSGEEGLEMFRQLKPDIVILDIIMPGIDGLETAGILMEEDANARIVMLSSLFDANLLAEVKKMGLKFLLPKPLEKDVLFATLAMLEH